MSGQEGEELGTKKIFQLATRMGHEESTMWNQSPHGGEED